MQPIFEPSVWIPKRQRQTGYTCKSVPSANRALYKPIFRYRTLPNPEKFLNCCAVRSASSSLRRMHQTLHPLVRITTSQSTCPTPIPSRDCFFNCITGSGPSWSGARHSWSGAGKSRPENYWIMAVVPAFFCTTWFRKAGRELAWKLMKVRAITPGRSGNWTSTARTVWIISEKNLMSSPYDMYWSTSIRWIKR